MSGELLLSYICYRMIMYRQLAHNKCLDSIVSCLLDPSLLSFPQTEIQLFVNRLDSVESVLPYEYDA